MNEEEVRNAVIDDFRNYKKWKARLRTIQVEIDYIRIKGSQIQGDNIRSGGPSDPTYDNVQKNESLNREFAYVAYCANRVEACLDAMTDSQRQLITKRYFDGLLTKEVMKMLRIEKSEYYKRLDQIIHICAMVCGYKTEKGQKGDNMETKIH